MAYAKLQCLNGKDCYISTLPFSIGSDPSSDLYVNCAKLLPTHCLVKFTKLGFGVEPLGPLYISTAGSVTEEDDQVPLSDLSFLAFECHIHPAHVYYFILPVMSGSSQEGPRRAAIPENEDLLPIGSVLARQADSGLLKKWGMNDRENLKKWLLMYGYNRFKKLQTALSEGGAFIPKPISEIRSFSTALVRTTIENLPFEKQQLKKKLLGIIEEKEEDFYVPPRINDWGAMVRQRAVPWGKRLFILFKIKELISKFKAHFKDRPLKWNNLINFIPSSAFYGQRPAAWWTRRHDVDLIRGTHKHGYANYTQMRSDPALSFSLVDSDSTFKQFPSADTITRRLKKIMIFFEKVEEIDFENEQQLFESTDWTDQEKRALVKLLTNEGVPLNSEGKNNWEGVKAKFDLLNHDKPVASFEKLVQHLRILAQMVSQPEEEGNPVKDADGFSLNSEEAENFQNNFNKMQFIRKHILKPGNELFASELVSLEKALDKLKTEHSGKPWLEEWWQCGVHDRYILESIADRGLIYLPQIPSTGCFSEHPIPEEDCRARLDYLCEFFKTISNIQKCSKKKRPTEDLNFDERGQIRPAVSIKKMKAAKFQVPRDEMGNIEFPLTINNSLTILQLGEIDTVRPAYHSNRNIFPIGYKSIREHSSIFKPKDRMQYLCEILDGGPKPLFRVTPMQDGQLLEDHAIAKDSCTGCWIVICNKVNEIQKSRRSKVTVSGTDRYGLWDPNVVKLIQQLPGADLLIPN